MEIHFKMCQTFYSTVFLDYCRFLNVTKRAMNKGNLNVKIEEINTVDYTISTDKYLYFFKSLMSVNN